MAPLHGLVLAGGRSARMGRDKAQLDYHGRPQADHAAGLLAAHCDKVYFSCRPDQAGLPEYAGRPLILDAYAGLGPLAGILSALEAHPEAAFLVAACDLPYLDAAAVAALVAGRDPARLATAFEGPLGAGSKSGRHGPRHPAGTPADRASKDGSTEGAHRTPKGPALPDLSLGPNGRLPEPLFAIFEPAMLPRLRELTAIGIDCPRKAIIKSACRILPAPDPRFLANVNSPDEYARAKADLSAPPRA